MSKTIKLLSVCWFTSFLFQKKSQYQTVKVNLERTIGTASLRKKKWLGTLKQTEIHSEVTRAANNTLALNIGRRLRFR